MEVNSTIEDRLFIKFNLVYNTPLENSILFSHDSLEISYILCRTV